MFHSVKESRAEQRSGAYTFNAAAYPNATVQSSVMVAAPYQAPSTFEPVFAFSCRVGRRRPDMSADIPVRTGEDGRDRHPFPVARKTN
jgi:hypothetical protein